MGVELKWEIDAADDQVSPVRPERPASRRIWLRLLLLLLLLCAGAATAVILRLQELERQQENLLRATVEAEVTALRLGDEQAFLDLQESTDSAWPMTQRANFEAWQTRKLEGQTLSGNAIVALEQDGERAWVQVEETIAGEIWLHTWHYEFTDRGWRHSSPQNAWRGEARAQQANSLHIEYDSLDEPLVQALAPQLEAWLARGCALLSCAPVPSLSLRIQAQPDAPGWSPGAAWTLLVPSPWTRPARSRVALSTSLRDTLARLLAGRLLGDRVGQPASHWTEEARWLHGSAVAWLAGRMLEQPGGQRLLDSLSKNYGDPTLLRLLQLLRPDSSLTLFSEVTGTGSLHEAALDWSDLLAWQLQQGATHRQRGDLQAFLAGHDLRDGSLETLARARFAVGEFASAITVSDVAPVADPSGEPTLRAIVTDPAGSVSRHFRLVDGRWLRAD